MPQPVGVWTSVAWAPVKVLYNLSLIFHNAVRCGEPSCQLKA